MAGLPPVRWTERACIFFILGTLFITVSIIIFGIYFTIGQITSSTSHAEVLPTYIVAASLAISGILVLVLFWKRWKPLVIGALLSCVVSALLCVETVILTGTHVIQPMLHMDSCTPSPPSTCLCQSPYKRTILYLEYLESDPTTYQYDDASNCGEITSTLLHLVYGLVFIYVISFLVSVVSCALIGVVVRLQKTDDHPQSRYDDVFSIEGSILSFPSDVEDRRNVSAATNDSGHSPSRAVENEYSLMNKVERANSLVENHKGASHHIDDSVKCPDGSNPGELGKEESMNGWGSHKRNTKKHQQQRAVTLQNLDSRELMLVLGLQMRFMKENGATTSSNNINDQTDDAAKFVAATNNEQNLVSNLTVQQMQKILQKLNNKNTEKAFPHFEMERNASEFAYPFPKERAGSLGEDRVTMPAHSESQLNDLNRSKTPGPYKTSQQVMEFSAKQRLMNIRNCKSTPPIRGHPHDRYGDYLYVVNGQCNVDSGHGNFPPPDKLKAEGGDVKNDVMWQYNSENDRIYGKWYGKDKMIGEGMAGYYGMEGERVRGNVAQYGTVAGGCAYDDSSTCGSWYSNNTRCTDSDNTRDMSFDGYNDKTKRDILRVNDSNFIPDGKFPYESYNDSMYGKVPSAQSPYRYNSLDKGNRIISGHIERGGKLCIDNMGSGDEAFNNVVCFGENHDKKDSSYVLMSVKCNNEKCLLEPVTTLEYGEGHLIKTRCSAGGPNHSYPRPSGVNSQVKNNLMSAVQTSPKDADCANLTKVRRNSTNSRDTLPATSSLGNRTTSPVRGNRNHRSNVQIRTNPYTAFLPYSRSGSVSHDDLHNGYYNDTDTRDFIRDNWEFSVHKSRSSPRTNATASRSSSFNGRMRGGNQSIDSWRDQAFMENLRRNQRRGDTLQLVGVDEMSASDAPKKPPRSYKMQAVANGTVTDDCTSQLLVSSQVAKKDARLFSPWPTVGEADDGSLSDRPRLSPMHNQIHYRYEDSLERDGYCSSPTRRRDVDSSLKRDKEKLTSLPPECPRKATTSKTNEGKKRRKRAKSTNNLGPQNPSDVKTSPNRSPYVMDGDNPGYGRTVLVLGSDDDAETTMETVI